MTTFNKFNSHVEDIREKKIDFSADVFKWMLTNTAPVATNTIKANLTEIAAGNGYTAGGVTQTISSSSQTGGAYTADMSGSPVITAAGGSIGPFRYVAMYDDTATNDELIGWYDYGSSITLADTETFTINSDGVTLISAS